MGVWIRVSLRESSYHAWVVNVLETVATSWEIYTRANIINSPQAIFFLSLYLFLPILDTPTRWIRCTCAKRFNTSASSSICSGNVGRLLCILSTSNYRDSAFKPVWRPKPLLCLYRLRCSSLDIVTLVILLHIHTRKDRRVNLRCKNTTKRWANRSWHTSTQSY